MRTSSTSSDRRAHQLEGGMVAPVQVLEHDQPPCRPGRASSPTTSSVASRWNASPSSGCLVVELDPEERARDPLAPLAPARPARSRIRSAIFAARRFRADRLRRCPRARGSPAGTARRAASRRRGRSARTPSAGRPRARARSRGRSPPRRAALLPSPGSPESRTIDAVPSPVALERAADEGHLALAPDERGLERPRRAHPPGRGEAAAAHGRTPPGSRLPFKSISPSGSTSNRSATSRYVSSVIWTVPGAAGLLHPGGDVHRVAHRRVLLAVRRPDLPDDDRPRVDPDADVQVEAPLVREPLAERRDRGDDLEPRHHRALRVVLVRGRGAEEGEDRVAHQAGDRALVADDRLDQPLVGGVHHLGPVLGVELLGHRGRAADVAEQHRDDAPLARPGRLGAASAASGAPHALQNRAPGGFAAPHAAHPVTGAP